MCLDINKKMSALDKLYNLVKTLNTNDDKNCSLWILWKNRSQKVNIPSENIKYPVHNKKVQCQHKKLHPLKARRGKYISETIYRYIEKSFSMTHRNISL